MLTPEQLDALERQLAGWEPGAVGLIDDRTLRDLLAAARREAALREDATKQLEAWSGCVRRLIAAAPIRAVIDETGLPESGHSTPPERQAIREAASRVVDAWVERDRALLSKVPQ